MESLCIVTTINLYLLRTESVSANAVKGLETHAAEAEDAEQ